MSKKIMFLIILPCITFYTLNYMPDFDPFDTTSFDTSSAYKSNPRTLEYEQRIEQWKNRNRITDLSPFKEERALSPKNDPTDPFRTPTTRHENAASFNNPFAGETEVDRAQRNLKKTGETVELRTLQTTEDSPHNLNKPQKDISMFNRAQNTLYLQIETIDQIIAKSTKSLGTSDEVTQNLTGMKRSLQVLADNMNPENAFDVINRTYKLLEKLDSLAKNNPALRALIDARKEEVNTLFNKFSKQILKGNTKITPDEIKTIIFITAVVLGLASQIVMLIAIVTTDSSAASLST